MGVKSVIHIFINSIHRAHQTWHTHVTQLSSHKPSYTIWTEKSFLQKLQRPFQAKPEFILEEAEPQKSFVTLARVLQGTVELWFARLPITVQLLLPPDALFVSGQTALKSNASQTLPAGNSLGIL